MASSNRRQRELAAARAQRRQARLQTVAQRRARTQRLGRIAVAVGLVGGFLLVWNKPWTPKPTTASPQVSATPSTAVSSSGTPSANPSASASASVSTPNNSGYTPQPGRYSTMKIDTNRGSISIALDNRAPRTLTSFSSLSNRSFFNNTICHRLTTSGLYVLQCGDTKGNGTGGPGYTIPDENLPNTANGLLLPSMNGNYERGVVAMANSGPNTGGSQFFIVYKDSPLPPNYAVWGKVTSGLDVIDRIAAAGVAGGSTDGAPAKRVVITSTSVK